MIQSLVPRIATIGGALLFACLALHLVATSMFASDPFAWEQLPELPDEFGFGGPLVGSHNGALIVAGGANFPHGPPWPVDEKPAGEKVWHDRIFVLLPGEKQWHSAGRLPRTLAYAPVVSHASGMYVLGGESFDQRRKNHDVAGVVRLTWDRAKKQIHVEDGILPPLPKATSYHGGAIIGDTVYIAASHAKDVESRRLDTKSMWAIDLSQASEDRQWKSLPAWPGKPRYKMALAAAEVISKSSRHREQLFLFSGGSWVKDQAGEMDLSQFEYYDDAYRFDPATQKWTQLADLPKLKETRAIDTSGYRYDMSGNSWLSHDDKRSRSDVHALFDAKPRAAAAAIAMRDGLGRILLFSGSTGRYVTMDVKDRPLFPPEVLAYDLRSNRWSIAGAMPSAVVTSGATWWRNRIVIASGEIRPGVRTRKVQALRVR